MQNPHGDAYKEEDIQQCPFMKRKQQEGTPFNEKIKIESSMKKEKPLEEVKEKCPR